MHPASKPDLPNNTTQNGVPYQNIIDAAAARAAHFTDQFAPYAQDVADMTINLWGGEILDGTSNEIISVPGQTTPTIVAPVTFPRIDLVRINNKTGLLTIEEGDEEADPEFREAKACCYGDTPVAHIALTVGQTEIVNIDITDVRDLHYMGDETPGGGVVVVEINGSTRVQAATLTDPLPAGVEYRLITTGLNYIVTLPVHTQSKVGTTFRFRGKITGGGAVTVTAEGGSQIGGAADQVVNVDSTGFELTVQSDRYDISQDNRPGAGGLAEHYFLNEAADIGGFLAVTGDVNDSRIGAGTTIVSPAVATTVVLNRWLFDTGALGAEIPSGRLTTTINAFQTGATSKPVALEWRAYQRASGGGETLIGTSNQSVDLTTGFITYPLDIFFGSDVHFGTDRIILELVAIKEAGGVSPTVSYRLEESPPVAFTNVPQKVGGGDSGIVSDIGTRTTAGTWIIADLTIGKPLEIILAVGSSTDQSTRYRVSSGTLDVSSAVSELSSGNNIGDGTPNSITIVPSATSVSIVLAQIGANHTLRAYQ